jgi:hypothetical protein
VNAKEKSPFNCLTFKPELEDLVSAMCSPSDGDVAGAGDDESKGMGGPACAIVEELSVCTASQLPVDILVQFYDLLNYMGQSELDTMPDTIIFRAGNPKNMKAYSAQPGLAAVIECLNHLPPAKDTSCYKRDCPFVGYAKRLQTQLSKMEKEARRQFCLSLLKATDHLFNRLSRFVVGWQEARAHSDLETSFVKDHMLNGVDDPIKDEQDGRGVELYSRIPPSLQMVAAMAQMRALMETFVVFAAAKPKYQVVAGAEGGGLTKDGNVSIMFRYRVFTVAFSQLTDLLPAPYFSYRSLCVSFRASSHPSPSSTSAPSAPASASSSSSSTSSSSSSTSSSVATVSEKRAEATSATATATATTTDKTAPAKDNKDAKNEDDDDVS